MAAKPMPLSFSSCAMAAARDRHRRRSRRGGRPAGAKQKTQPATPRPGKSRRHRCSPKKSKLTQPITRVVNRLGPRAEQFERNGYGAHREPGQQVSASERLDRPQRSSGVGNGRHCRTRHPVPVFNRVEHAVRMPIYGGRSMIAGYTNSAWLTVSDVRPLRTDHPG